MNHSLYQTASERITYNFDESWLTVHQCGNEWGLSIGPLGLIDLGLELCNIARGHGTESGIYSHPDGVFHIVSPRVHALPWCRWLTTT